MSGLLLHIIRLWQMAEDVPSEEEVKKARKKRTEAEEHREQSETIYGAKSAYDTKKAAGGDGDPGTLSGGGKRARAYF